MLDYEVDSGSILLCHVVVARLGRLRVLVLAPSAATIRLGEQIVLAALVLRSLVGVVRQRRCMRTVSPYCR